MKKMLRYLSLCCFMLAFLSCKNGKKKDNHTAKNIDTVIKPEVNTVEVAKTWVDDFKEFREAVYTQNTVKMKSYFDFPLDDEASILYLCNLTEEERNQRKNEVDDPDLFYEKDFDKYYKRIFDKKFLAGILKLKTAPLVSGEIVETPEFADPDMPYIMFANLDKESQSFQLNMAFHNNMDENGIYHSEGEHNIIYLFDVIEGRKIMFKKIVVAG